MKLNKEELQAFWMPFSSNRNFKNKPRMLVRAAGMHYYDDKGREILDATSGLWCCNAGHCRQPIVDAVSKQIAELDFAPTFQMGHPNVFKFADQLTKEIFPRELNRIIFTNSGSEAIDSAIKTALAYHTINGQSSKTLLISRERGYHGVNLGGTSINGISKTRTPFNNLLTADFLPHTHGDEKNLFSRGQPKHRGLQLANELERIIALHGVERIAAVFIEPIAGSTGVLIPPKGYLERIRQICTDHGILLVFDEVITGFGRCGAPTAAERFNVIPDMITFAKGANSGTVPMGGVAIRSEIQQVFLDAAPGNTIDFFHGYTYAGHPVATAAGLAALQIYKDENLLTRAKKLESYWADALHSLKGIKNIIDIRNFGLIGAIELKPRLGKPTARAFDAFLDAFHNEKLLLRTTGDTIAMSPPLIVKKNQIDEIVDKLKKILRRLK